MEKSEGEEIGAEEDVAPAVDAHALQRHLRRVVHVVHQDHRCGELPRGRCRQFGTPIGVVTTTKFENGRRRA